MGIKAKAEKLISDKKTVFIILLGILGIFLLIISNYSDEKDIDSIKENVVSEKEQMLTALDIEQELENRLEKMISGVKGVGQVSVMVRVGSAGEYVYAENTKTDSDIDSSLEENEIVVFKQNDDDTGLMITVKNPEILGVAVVCQGGESSVVKSEVTSLVACLFGIGADRIYVGCS